MLALWVRCSCSLAGAARERASSVLGAMLGAVLAGPSTAFWPASWEAVPEVTCKRGVPKKHLVLEVVGGLVLFGPLVPRCPQLPSWASGLNPQSATSGRVATLAKAFLRAGVAQPLAFLASLLCWAARAVELSPWVGSGSVSPLDRPVLRAAKRARRIDPDLKAAVVDESAAGTLVRSNAKLVSLAAGHNKKWTLAARAANMWDLPEARKGATACREGLASHGGRGRHCV